MIDQLPWLEGCDYCTGVPRNPAAITFILLAVILIALGRHQIRAARRAPEGRLRRKSLGWMLVSLGLVLMIVGVLLW